MTNAGKAPECGDEQEGAGMAVEPASAFHELQVVTEACRHVTPAEETEDEDDSSEAYVSSYQSDTEDAQRQYLISQNHFSPEATQQLIDLEETAENQLILEDAFRYQQQTTSIQTTQETLFETSFSMAGRPSRESKSFSENSGKESGNAGMTEAEKTSLASPRISNQSRSNSDIYQDVYQTNTLSESYEDRYRKSTTEVYDSYKTAKTE